MPYIKRETRYKLDDCDPETGLKNIPQTAGELNYCITQLIIGYMLSKDCCYQTFNDIIGVLECAKLELYRRVISPYEDTKIEQNGDVYPNAA